MRKRAEPNHRLAGLAPVKKHRGIGIMPNLPHQTFPGFMTGEPYELAIVEFDDQGNCYNRKQMDGITARLDALRAAETDVIFVVFVHGWKHDARSDDQNLCAFQAILAQMVTHEQQTHRGKPDDKGPRPVLGIFVGWRGVSLYDPTDNLETLATFWSRQSAGRRVATGSVRELFGRLRHYRNHRIKQKGTPLLVLVGHSFGGMIVYSALAQSLIEAASAPADHVVPSLADLVLLVNPAIEGARYLPIKALIDSPAFKARTARQLPVFVCATAHNDYATGIAYPIGNIENRLMQRTIGSLEKSCTFRTIGHIEALETHQLSSPQGGWSFKLTPDPAPRQVNPFWVVKAAPEVINGHGGIWQQPFLAFVASLLFAHVQDSRTVKAGTPPPPPPAAPFAPTGGPASPTSPTGTADLNMVAQSIEPLALE